MECYLLSEPKVRGYRKRMLSLRLNKGTFWVSEQRLVDQANTIHRDSWMTELEIEKLDGNLAENDSYKEERSDNDTGSNLEEVRDILTALDADEEIGNLEVKEVAIIEEIAEVLERTKEDKLLAIRDIPRRSYLRKQLRLIKFCVNVKHSITNTNELLYAGAVIVTNRLGVKFNKAAQRKESMWRKRLQNKVKELRKD